MTCALLAAAAAGCGTAGKPKPDPAEAVVKLEPAPALTARPEQSWRWLDSLGQPYSEAFRTSFSYDEAELTVRFPKRSPRFQGKLTGEKLKPNFTYQMKLVGMPPSLWGEKGHALSNRRIGELGRWWRPGPTGGNLYWLDDQDKDELEAYLVFGYFVTDAEGRAEVAFRLDSSYHVIWKTSQWPAAEEDSPPTKHPIIARAGSYGYDQAFPPGELEIYLEHQYGRPPRGEVRLPPGHYKCFFLLTEESFHAWGDGDGGEWAAALAAPIEFTITGKGGDTVDLPSTKP